MLVQSLLALPLELPIDRLKLCYVRIVNQPTPPDLAKTTQWVLGVVFLSIGLLLIALGGVQLAYFLTGAADRITIEPFAIGGGLIFAIPGALRLRRAATLRRLALHGLPASAQLLAINHTKSEVEGSPIVKLTLRITHPTIPPYDVTIRWLMRPFDGARLIVGHTLPIKIDPKNPHEVILA